MARHDAGEFTSFALRTQPALRRTAFLMAGDWAQASDHVQEAYIRDYRRCRRPLPALVRC
jgi:DNA-directed RNA polymerase specialized sigma24 family protein